MTVVLTFVAFSMHVLTNADESPTEDTNRPLGISGHQAGERRAFQGAASVTSRVTGATRITRSSRVCQ
jgi:hypothetical protein